MTQEDKERARAVWRDAHRRLVAQLDSDFIRMLLIYADDPEAVLRRLQETEDEQEGER